MHTYIYILNVCVCDAYEKGIWSQSLEIEMSSKTGIEPAPSDSTNASKKPPWFHGALEIPLNFVKIYLVLLKKSENYRKYESDFQTITNRKEGGGGGGE